jgi:broad specificity phosphatase PhoE
MNHLQHLQHLRNTYYAMRHGKSLANDEEVIVSSPEQAVLGYGLSKDGRRQVATAVGTAKHLGVLDHTALIVSSDFARARESAEIAAGVLGTRDLILTTKLRERNFGTWDGQHHSNYELVWAADALDPAHKDNGVESTQEVLDRATSLVADLERDYPGRTVLLVSHGDVLQILQTAFDRVDSGAHRLLPHLKTGEIRKLGLKALPAE